MHDGIVKPIKNVRYVPNLKRNLITLEILEDDGDVFKSNKNILKVMKGSLVVLKVSKRNGLYYLLEKIVITQDPSSFTVTENKSKLWHNRMEHIGNKGLKYLSNQKLLGKDIIEIHDSWKSVCWVSLTE